MWLVLAGCSLDQTAPVVSITAPEGPVAGEVRIAVAAADESPGLADLYVLLDQMPVPVVDGYVTVDRFNAYVDVETDIKRLPFEDGSFDIVVSRSARAGNWLPVGRAEQIRFLVRHYDTPIATGKSFQDIRMPSIQRLECRS